MGHVTSRHVTIVFFMNVHSKIQVHVRLHKVLEPIQKLCSHQCGGTLMFDAQTW